MPNMRWIMSYEFRSTFNTLSSSAKFFKNRLKFDKVTDSLKVGTFFETQCRYRLEFGQMPNVMAALPNIGDGLCSTPQSLADAHY